MLLAWLREVLLRPFRAPEIDYAARQQIEQRHAELVARLAGARQVQAAAALRRRRAD